MATYNNEVKHIPKEYQRDVLLDKLNNDIKENREKWKLINEKVKSLQNELEDLKFKQFNCKLFLDNLNKQKENYINIKRKKLKWK